MSRHDHPFAHEYSKYCRVVATIHDSDGKLVTYNLSSSAYSVKSHPRNSKRSLQASTRSRMKRRSTINAAHLTSVTGSRTLPSNSFAASSSGSQQFGRAPNTGGLPAVRARHEPMRRDADID